MALSDINSKIVNSFTNTISKSVVINAIGYLLFGIVAMGLFGWWAWSYIEKKKYNKKITAFEILGDYYSPTIRDTAKTVKLGRGGFEILFLRKQKTWKLAYGGRIGKADYYFFIDSIGYWYNGALSGKVQYIDQMQGLIPVITTNPTMRAQYTALEKQIDALHSEKKSFWDKYGTWVLSIAYVLIMGIFVWLSFREVHQFLGSGSELAQRMTELADAMSKIAVNLKTQQPSGLIPAT